MLRLSSLLIVCSCLWLNVSAQVTSELITLVPGQPVEREIAGGQSHSYQIQLAAGQFVRFRLEQRALDSTLILTAPDGGQIAEANLSGSGEPELLAFEAAAAGDYRLMVRGNGAVTMRGSYRLEATVQATASAADRKFIAAQNLMLEAEELAKQMPRTAPQVIERLEQAVTAWRELNLPDRQALALNRLGRMHLRQNQNEKAIGDLEQALAINRELKNRSGEASALNVQANAYFNLRQFEKASEIFEQALAVYRAVPDRRWEGLILHSLGNTNNNLNRPEKAIEYFEQALTILREVKDLSSEGQALTSLGNTYLTRGQTEKAVAITEAAVARFREVKDRTAEGRALNNLAIAHSRLGHSEKAIEILNQLLALYRELKNRTEEASTLISLGTAYGGSGQTEQAIAWFTQGLELSREIKDRQREALALSNLGLAYSFLSQFEKAIDYLEQALPLARETRNRVLEGSTFGYLGTCYAGLSRFERAIESHEQALAIFRELKYRLGEGNALQNLGSVYQYLGRDGKSIEYYEQALVIFRETKYRVGEGNLFSNIGDSYGRLGRDTDAIRSHEAALSIFRELKYRLGEGSSLLELGIRFASLNQPEKALAFYEQALPILREVKSREYEGLTLFRMGQAKQKMGSRDEAARLLAESVAIFNAIGNRNLEFGALTGLARAERERGHQRQALSLVEQSVRIAESLRAEAISPESRASFLAAVQETYQVYTDLLMQQHKAEPQRGLAALALEVSERQRARSLLDLLAESRADLRQGTDPALIERERTLSKQLSDKAQQLAQTAQPAQAAALKTEISRLETDLERAQAAIRKASPHYAALTQPQPLRLQEIQAQLDADTVLLEYALGEERSYLWAITKDSLSSYELPKAEQINQRAREVYELLTARSTITRGESAIQRQQRLARAEAKLPVAAAGLSRMLLAPVAAELGNKRLVIVADGALQYVPFAMLPQPESGSRKSEVGSRNKESQQVASGKSAEFRIPNSEFRPLIINHEIVSLPSASALAIQRAELAGRQPAPKMLAVIADPVFDRTDARLKASATDDKAAPATSDFADTRTIEHLAEQPGNKSGVAVQRLVIPRLPYTRREADQLLALTPKGSGFEAVDFQANRNTVLSPELSQYRYVHFATHGLLDTERPGLSSLVLSLVDAQGRPQNGFLRANEIYNLKLPAELVVLSACQTGLGKEIKGEGLVGLTRGFMYAGAARVVVSLWSVNDQATSDLMTKFYEKMLKQGERPAAALRAAQVEMWKQKQWRSPFYWAAFTLQGEWK